MNPPQWTDQIPDNILCNYFYVFFVIFSVWAGLALLYGVWVFTSSKMTVGMMVAVLINILLSFGISATSALFLYLICERALKPSLKNKQAALAPARAMMFPFLYNDSENRSKRVDREERNTRA
jgi:glucan phosphoethanolaminetransferase (alkaline phosphatase superfamily)